MVKIKVCGITNLEDALAAIEFGADYLGFNFYPPSARCVTPEQAHEMIARLPAGIDKFALFVNEQGARQGHSRRRRRGRLFRRAAPRRRDAGVLPRLGREGHQSVPRQGSRVAAVDGGLSRGLLSRRLVGAGLRRLGRTVSVELARRSKSGE